MAKQQSRLGRGLDALFAHSDSATDQLTKLPLDVIRPGKYQPRNTIGDDSLQELADSIRAQGVIQPVVVREIGLGDYELIAGERRWRASRLAGLTEIPAVVKAISDDIALAMALIENIQRQDLDPIEEAKGLQRLTEEFNMTHEAVAVAVGRSRSAVSNLLRLLQLPEPIQQLLHQKKIEMGHARALLSLPVINQIQLAKLAADQGWSVRETERRSKTMPVSEKPTSQTDPDIVRLSETLSEQLGMQVKIKHGKNGGRLTINYNSLDDLERLMQKLLTDS